MCTESAEDRAGVVERLVLEIQKDDTSLLPVLWQQVEGFIRKQATYRWHRMREAGTVSHFSDEVDDYVQQSYFALLEAVRGYNPEAGAGFETYLSFFLKRAFAEVDGIRGKKRDALLYADSLDEATESAEFGEIQKINLIIDPTDQYKELEDAIDAAELHKALVMAVDALPGRKREIIKARYFGGQKQTEIARQYGATKQYISATEKSALADLRQQAAKYGLDAFLDVRTAFIRPSGYEAFINAGFTSSVELSVYERERYKKEYQTIYAPIRQKGKKRNGTRLQT